jgi:hypothetical protein
MVTVRERPTRTCPGRKVKVRVCAPRTRATMPDQLGEPVVTAFARRAKP